MSTIPAWLDRPNVLTISDLTAQIRDQLEEEFKDVWVVGELSSFRAPSSGHLYFTLKDEECQMKAVMFRSYAGLLRFVLKMGWKSLSEGVSVCTPRVATCSCMCRLWSRAELERNNSRLSNSKPH